MVIWGLMEKKKEATIMVLYRQNGGANGNYYLGFRLKS